MEVFHENIYWEIAQTELMLLFLQVHLNYWFCHSLTLIGNKKRNINTQCLLNLLFFKNLLLTHRRFSDVFRRHRSGALVENGLRKLQVQACNFTKARTPSRLFYLEFYEMFQKIHFMVQRQTAAFGNLSYNGRQLQRPTQDSANHF